MNFLRRTFRQCQKHQRSSAQQSVSHSVAPGGSSFPAMHRLTTISLSLTPSWSEAPTSSKQPSKVKLQLRRAVNLQRRAAFKPFIRQSPSRSQPTRSIAQPSTSTSQFTAPIDSEDSQRTATFDPFSVSFPSTSKAKSIQRVTINKSKCGSRLQQASQQRADLEHFCVGHPKKGQKHQRRLHSR